VKALQRYQKIFGTENFYLEIQDHPKIPEQAQVNEKIIKLAKTYNVPLVATNDVHYAKAEDAEAHDILICVQTNHLVADQERMRYGCDFSLKSAEQIAAAFPDHPEALANTVKIAEQCNLELPIGGHFIMPNFTTPAGQSAPDYLRELCCKGMLKRYGVEPSTDGSWQATATHAEIKESRGPKYTFTPQEIGERLDYELGVIHDKGYDEYFLIVGDLMQWARRNNQMQDYLLRGLVSCGQCRLACTGRLAGAGALPTASRREVGARSRRCRARRDRHG